MDCDEYLASGNAGASGMLYFDACVISHRVIKPSSSRCQKLQSVSVFFDYSLVITYPPEHLQDRLIKRAFTGFGKALMGTEDYGPRSLYLQIKTFSYQVGP